MSVQRNQVTFDHLRRKSATELGDTVQSLGRPKFAFVNHHDNDTRRLDLTVLLPDELMDQILTRLQDHTRTKEATELLEDVTEKLSDVIYNALIDLTQMQHVEITSSARVTGYQRQA